MKPRALHAGTRLSRKCLSSTGTNFLNVAYLPASCVVLLHDDFAMVKVLRN